MADLTTFITTLAAVDTSWSVTVDDVAADPNQSGYVKRFHQVSQVLVPLIMAIITVIGISGNSIVLYIIIRHREMQNITNFFIANLAVTDIALLTMCTIPTAANIAGILPMSDAMCKGVSYMQFVTVQATCVTLTAMSVDRYILIVHAVKSRTTRTTNKAVIINVSIWLVSFAVHLPVAIYQTLDQQTKICNMAMGPQGLHEKYYYLFSFISMYILPLIIILACYANILFMVWRKSSAGTESAAAHERSIRQKRKITRMVFIVVLLFAVCWLPIQCLLMWSNFSSGLGRSQDLVTIGGIQFFALSLSYANSCVNPFIYAFTTASFKKHFKRVFAFCVEPEESADEKPTGNAGYRKAGKYLNEYSSVNTCDTKL
ncbi:G-protein coupled receptor 54-like [Diadema antillarum]|uniref:G-protein coupled receptor 54-like n=1 Tax=Diadema antillarum TaxID=105358 RepID=UPI003A885697